MLKNGAVLNGIDCISDEMKEKAEKYELLLGVNDSINNFIVYSG